MIVFFIKMFSWKNLLGAVVHLKTLSSRHFTLSAGIILGNIVTLVIIPTTPMHMMVLAIN